MFSRILTFFYIWSLGISLALPALSHAADKPRIGVFIFKLDDVYINSVANNIEKSLEGKAELTIFDGENNQPLQIEQITNYLKQDVNAVAINLVDVKVGQQVLHMIRAKGIPVIFFNTMPSLTLMKNYDKARYVGTDAMECSLLQGEIIAKLWKENPQYDRNKDGVCHFIMLQGGLAKPEALLRTRYSVQSARTHGIAMQQVGDTLICDWDAECAYKTSKLAFSLHGHEIDFIISNNDDMAMGAIQTLQENGFNKDGNGPSIPVVGVDAIEKAKKAIDEGIMHGTVLQDAHAMGTTISTMLINTLQDKPYLEGLPYAWDNSGIAIRIPYRAYEHHNNIGH